MGRKIESFYDELLDQQLVEAINNDFGRAVLRMSAQNLNEVRDEVFVYFSAVAMQQINHIAAKHNIADPLALNELYQVTRANLIQGFRIGQNLRNPWLPS